MAGPSLRRLARVALPTAPGSVTLEITGAVVSALQPTAEAPEWLLLPGFANMHTHAERAFTGHGPPASFADAVRAAEAARKTADEAQFCDRARRLFACAHRHGALRLRTHTDVDDLTGPRALGGVLAARAAFAGRLDVEIVAFASARLDPTEAAGRKRLADALAQGADLLGAAPALAGDPRAAVAAILDLARVEGAAVDLHLDEHGDPAAALIGFVIEAVRARKLEGRVALSHACALATLPAAAAYDIARGLADIGAVVITLPATNLYLQDRSAGATPRRRGITLVKELRAAGVPVWLGSDNVQDAFYPYGDADLLEDAFLAVLAAHLEEPSDLVAALSAGRGLPKPGDPADLVLVRAPSLTAALARRPAERLVMRAGRALIVPPALSGVFDEAAEGGLDGGA